MRQLRRVGICFALALVACGDDGVRHTPDARSADSNIDLDAAVIDAPPTPVTVTVTSAGSASPNVKVYFQNSDSTVVSNTMTDANGIASAVMAAGGFVTAVDPAAAAPFGGALHSLYTWSGVKPGDHLKFDSSGFALISFTITVPFDSNGLAFYYQVNSPCGGVQLQSAGSGAAPTGTIELTNCGATTDFIVVVTDMYSNPLDSFYVSGQAVANGQGLDLSAQTYTAIAERTYSYTNVPAGLTTFNVTDTAVSPEGQVYSYGGQAYGTTSTISAMWPMATFTGAEHVVASSFNDGQSSTQVMVDWGAYASTYSVNVGARQLTDFTSAPIYDPATHVMSWTETTTGVVPDTTFVGLYDFRSPTNWNWKLAAPHAGASVTFPTLPTDVFDFNPQSTDTVSLTVGAAKVPGGYDTARPVILELTNGPAGLVTGATGSLTFEEYTAPPSVGRELVNWIRTALAPRTSHARR